MILTAYIDHNDYKRIYAFVAGDDWRQVFIIDSEDEKYVIASKKDVKKIDEQDKIGVRRMDGYLGSFITKVANSDFRRLSVDNKKDLAILKGCKQIILYSLEEEGGGRESRRIFTGNRFINQRSIDLQDILDSLPVYKPKKKA